MTNAAGQPIIKVDHVNLYEAPNSITQKENAKGGIDRNYYDANGRQFKQISNNDHGHPQAKKYGKNGEHAHDYVYDEKGNLMDRPTRELTDQERKDNADFL